MDWMSFFKPKKAERKALVIGFTHYEQAIEIPGIRKSAFAIKNVLKEHYDKTANFDVTLLTESSKGVLPYKNEKDLRGQIISFLRSGKKADTGILYIISHGSKPTESQPPCFVFPGIPGSGTDLFIPMEDVAEEVNKSKFGNLVVVIDCCYAGSFVSEMNVPLRPGVSILTSSHDDELSHGDYFPFSQSYTLFSGFMKAALMWKAADNLTGVTTLASAYDFLCQNLGAAQHPVLQCNATTFLPLRQNRPSYTPEQMQLIHDCFCPPEGLKPRLSAPVRFKLKEAIPGLIQNHLVKEQHVTAASGRKKVVYSLTSKGQRLWDLVELSN